MVQNKKRACRGLMVIISGIFSGLFAQNPPPGWKGKVEIRDGLRVVKNPAEPLYGQVVLELEKDLVIGDDKDERSFFYYKTSTRVDRLGCFYIWDPNSFRIQKFDKEGKFVRTIGKKGEGPGEFRDAFQLKFLVDGGGRLYVRDNAKIHVFSVEGRFERSVPAAASGERNFAVLSGGMILRDDWAFEQDRMKETVVLTDEDGKILKTVAAFPSLRFEVQMKEKPRFTVYYPELILAPWTAEAALFGYPSAYRLQAVDGSGDTVLVIEKEEASARTTSREKSKLIDEFLAGNKKASRAELENQKLLPEFWPFFDALLADDKGRIYVQRTKNILDEVPGTTFDVFNREGFYLYEAKAAEDVCLAIGDGLLYSRKYDRDKECDQVFRYRIKNWPDLKS
jgi:hypothetical protein